MMELMSEGGERKRKRWEKGRVTILRVRQTKTFPPRECNHKSLQDTKTEKVID